MLDQIFRITYNSVINTIAIWETNLNKINSLIKNKYYVVYGLLVVASIIMYSMLLVGKTVWLDESFSMALIRYDYKTMCLYTAADVHPPLYYIILKFFTEPFNYSLLSAKIVSVVPYVIIIALGGLQLKKLFNEKISIYFMFLFMIFPNLMNYSIEIRMYSTAACFVFFCGTFAYSAYKSGKLRDYIIFALMGTAAASTHYFAMVSAGVIYIILLIALIKKSRKELLKWFFVSALTVVLYIPWLMYFIKQLAVKIAYEYWIPKITFSTVFNYGVTIFSSDGMSRIIIFFIAVSYISALVFSIKNKENEYCVISLCSLSVPIITTLFGIAVSLIIRPVFIIRYTVPALPLMILFFAIALGQIKLESFIVYAITIASVAGTNNFITLWHNEYAIPENELCSEYLDNYNVDAYLIIADEAVSGPIATYEPEMIKYSSVIGYHPNATKIEQLKIDLPHSLLVFVELTESIPDEISNIYEMNYITTATVSGKAVAMYEGIK